MVECPECGTLLHTENKILDLSYKEARLRIPAMVTACKCGWQGIYIRMLVTEDDKLIVLSEEDAAWENSLSISPTNQ